MAAAKINLPVIEKGATYRHTLIWADANGTPINLSNCTARLQIRADVFATDFLCELNTDNTGLVIDPLLGRIDLFISAIDTSALEGYGGAYDLEIYRMNGDTTRLAEGGVAFKPEVTR